ncbi:hypothetical protein A2U01_0028808, partial [Trifolium medium]|nr:hypothetical protein [Trifolium medium]
KHAHASAVESPLYDDATIPWQRDAVQYDEGSRLFGSWMQGIFLDVQGGTHLGWPRRL